jgi:hypothetical protein
VVLHVERLVVRVKYVAVTFRSMPVRFTTWAALAPAKRSRSEGSRIESKGWPMAEASTEHGATGLTHSTVRDYLTQRRNTLTNADPDQNR